MTKKFMLATFVAMALGAQAGPVVPTTIADGEFAADTKWYTMQIASAGFYLTDVEENGYMPLQQTSAIPADGDLWCFVGSDADGYTVYNRAAGTGKSLAAPVSPAGNDNGGSAYPTLKAPGADGQCYLWNFTASTNIADSYYMFEQGSPANKVNNRGNRLAFWTAGADAGSSVVIREAAVSALSMGGDGVITVNTDPLVTLSGEVAPVANADGTITLGDCNYYFSTPEGTAVRAYYIALADGSSKTVTGRGESNAQIPVAGPATVRTLRVQVAQVPAQSDNGYIVFRYDGTPDYGVVYRIPSITRVMAGQYKDRLFAVNDYRYCGGDIGAGRIDLHMSYSDDNGKTWSVPDDMRDAQGNPVARGTGAGTPAGQKQSVVNLDCGYGDPASISDRETGEILVVACCGRMNFFASTREDPQPSARWWSTDGGQTWTEPDYGQWEQIYALFDGTCPNGKIDGQFIGSGRMVQSSRVKVGTHYRVYCVMSGRFKETGQISNWVLYSDDFGHNWHILGDPMQPGVPTGADEPKCEELPDGSILLSARTGSGRNFNIFRYTDIAKAEGVWDSHVYSNLGTGHGFNACNGEILIVPVKNTTTGDKAFMAIQSFPNSGAREKVTLAWKILASPADYDEPSDFQTWNGYYQLTPLPSAYSTMIWQGDNTLGVLFEERTFGVDYCEVYRNLTLQQLTDGAWEYCAETDDNDKAAVQAAMVEKILNDIAGAPGNVVGNLSDEGKAQVIAAAEAYRANPSDATYADFCNAYYNNANIIMPAHGGVYSFRSAHGGLNGYPSADRWLSATATALSVSDAENETTRFTLVQPEGEETFAIYSGAKKVFVMNTPDKTETAVKLSTSADNAGRYNFSVAAGKVAIVSANPGNASYPAIHMNSSQKPVIWTEAAPASKWVMTLLDTTSELPDLSGIDEIAADGISSPVRYFDLQGRPVAIPHKGQLLINDRRQKRLF